MATPRKRPKKADEPVGPNGESPPPICPVCHLAVLKGVGGFEVEDGAMGEPDTYRHWLCANPDDE